jgi:gamma-glutamylcyclotransferase (GGCT)/AIG2-like uncharacterized protein YtfP
MDKETDLLFVYGTLMKGFDNPTAQYLHSTQEFLGEASFPGLLFKVSFYPGAVFLPVASSMVHGHLFKIVDNQEELFQQLDDYEGIGSHYPKPHDFKREVIPVYFNGQEVEALSYLFNTSYDHYPVISTGKFSPSDHPTNH